jgi:hypothetical protein
MEPLTQRSDIQTIGQHIQQHIHENWERIYHNLHEEMVRRYPEIGDSVYGLYGQQLFRPVHDHFKQVGLRAIPRLPGSFINSREWGPEEERQRWMWSKIVSAEGAAVGTIVTIFYHDHLQIHIPRAFDLIALPETAKGEVINTLSQMSAEFGEALEAREEIALYLTQMAQGEM